MQFGTQVMHSNIRLCALDRAEEETSFDECQLEELMIIQDWTTFEGVTLLLADEARFG